MAHLRLERVSIDVWCLSDHLVADVGVADHGVSGLDGLQDGGWRGNCVHGRWLRNQALAVHCGQSWHGRHCRNCGHCGRCVVRVSRAARLVVCRKSREKPLRIGY